MNIYRVGGSVRDQLLGLPVVDRDWVVVGATPQAMLDAGFRPVGKDFPVFLHPQTQEEYALARTERKTAPGYKGFVFHADAGVTLEEDLRRRDLTINAMAMDAQGRLSDPYGGQRDLQARQLRHVSPAFAEDPVRILRVARFAARFHAFSVATETLALMRDMVAAGEVDALVPERVWQEMARGLMEARPSRMLEVLRECGALAVLLPEVAALYGVPQPVQHHPEVDTGLHLQQCLDWAAAHAQPLAVRYAVLTHDLGKGCSDPAQWPHHYGHEARSERLTEAVSGRLKVPADCAELARLVAREHGIVHQAAILRPKTLVQLLERADLLRRPERLEHLLAACEADHCSRPGFGAQPYAPAQRVREAAAAFRSVDAGAIARALVQAGKVGGETIAARVHEARVAAVRQALEEDDQ